jgi:hypothetical protein
LSERPAEARLDAADLERVERLDDARLELARVAAALLGFAAVLFAFEAVLFALEAARLGFAAARLRPLALDFFEPPELVATCSPQSWGCGSTDYLTLRSEPRPARDRTAEWQGRVRTSRGG